MAIVMDKQALADRDFTMNVILPDVGEQHMLRVKNGVLLVYADTLSDDADVSITCPKNALFAILTNNQETVAKAVKVEGSAELLTLMMENMNQFPITGANPFNIIEPGGPWEDRPAREKTARCFQRKSKARGCLALPARKF